MTSRFVSFLCLTLLVTMLAGLFVPTAYAVHVPGHTEPTTQPAATPAPAPAPAQPASDQPAPTGNGGLSTGQILCAGQVGNPLCISTNVGTAVSAVKKVGGAVVETAAALAISTVASFVLILSNFLLGVAGSIFNLVVVKTIFQFSTTVGNSGGLLIAWGILRDIGNMLLLFGFIFIGISTILNIANYGAKKTLPYLIIFAILMNFSLFAAEAVIDVSNGLSVTLYKQAGSASCPGYTEKLRAEKTDTAEGIKELEKCATESGISGQIMEATGLWYLFGVNAIGYITYDMQGAVLAVGMAIFSTIGAIVLFAGAIMLIVRAVVLAFLMVTAPLGFAGMAIPPLQSAAKNWWHQLFNQAFFAPVMLLFILVSLKITASLTELSSERSLSGALSNPSVSTMGVVMVFCMVIGFLIASLVSAKKFSAIGSTFAINTASNFTVGGMARVTNLGVGAGANKLRKMQQASGFGGKYGRFAVNRGLRPLQGANLDLRRAGLGALLGAAGATTGAKPGEHTSFEDMKHRYQDFRDGKRGRELDAQYDKEVKVDKLEKEAHDVEAGKASDISDESKKFLTSLSPKEVAALHGTQAGLVGILANLTPEQYSKYVEDKERTDTERRAAEQGRYAKLREKATETGTSASAVADEVKKLTKVMSKAELERLPSEILSLKDAYGNQVVLDSFSDKQKEDIANSKNRTDQEREMVRNSTNVFLLENIFRTAGGGAAGARAVSAHAGGQGIRILNPSQASQLPNELLTHPLTAPSLTGPILKELQDKKDKLSAAEMTTISQNLDHLKRTNRLDPGVEKFITIGPGAGLW